MSLFWAGSAWLLGLILASLTPLQFWHWSALAISAAGAGIFFRKDRQFRILFILLCILFLGAARWVRTIPDVDQEHVAFYTDTASDVQLTGRIRTDPDVRDNQTLLVLEVERIWIPDLGIQKPVAGSILIASSPLKTYRYGERLRVTGLLATPPAEGDFSYRDYLARQGILAWMPDSQIRSLGMGRVNPVLDVLFTLRGAAFVEVQQLFPFPEAPLIAGILLGIESYIPDDLSLAYSATGTTHIIAISGFNITIMAGLTIAIFGRIFGRTRGLLLAGLIILLYTSFVGGDAPVVRAAIMGMLALIARYLGRRTHGLTSLAAAAMLMTWFHPRSIQDVGFQLSFFATLGLILYAEPLGKSTSNLLQRRFPHLDAKRWGNVLGEMVLFTLAAQITTLPIIAWHFHQISITSLIANALILPLQPFLMILSGLATILGMLWHPVGQMIAWFAWPFSALTNRLVILLANTPGGVIYTGAFSLIWVLLYYFFLFLITLVLNTSWKQKLAEYLQPLLSLRGALRVSTVLLTLALANFATWHSVTRLPDGHLHVTFLNVGRGESILIQGPSGGTVLVNGGSSPVRLATELGQHLSYPRRRIDWLLVGGTQYQQLAGFRDITSMTHVRAVLISGSSNSSVYRRFIDQALAAKIPIQTVQKGHSLDLGDGTTLEVVTSGSDGMTLLLKYGHARMLFPIGLSPAEIPDLQKHEQTAALTVVMLADGGYEAVNPVALLEHYNAQLQVVSCQAGVCPTRISASGKDGNEGIRTLSTDLYGSIELVTDGLNLWITSEHGPRNNSVVDAR
jgi:competence protein ComEC